MNGEQLDSEQPAEPPVLTETKNQGLPWRTLIGVLAVGITALLAYQYFQDQSNSRPIPPAPVSPVAPPQVNDPAATAQANPDSAQAQFEAGNAYAAAGQWPQAQAAYQRAIELDPKFQGAYANLGVVYYQLAQLDLAASQYQKALELDPTDGDVAYNLGALYLQQALLNPNSPNPELLQQAIDQLQQARDLDPKLAEPYFSLGVAYNALNQKQEAIEAFETFLARYSGQDSRASQEAQRYLDALRN
ncbi:MAG: hypothetical protein DPW09_15580 [Anaerolineae bacterium]|nr:tetratricopeptide repeat protein [Anaerolineales bacterium]MCQ3974861.1 hypothetical protein [Anaerolineae bacterium]